MADLAETHKPDKGRLGEGRLGKGRLGKNRLWRLILLVYLAGIALDVAWHLGLDLTTGDREIETYDWVSAVQASLFWPLDVAAQLLLALR